MTVTLQVHPLTTGRMDDLARVLGPNGAGGCWCLWFRQTSREFDAHHGDDNRRALRALVDAGAPTGLLGYADGVPVGWVSVAPRSAFGRIERSPLFRTDEPPDGVWSIVCLTVARHARRRGVTAGLLDAAVDHAAAHGATVVEGYAVVPRDGTPASALYHGTVGMFAAAGFTEAAAPSATRRLMRRTI